MASVAIAFALASICCSGVAVFYAAVTRWHCTQARLWRSDPHSARRRKEAAD